ncbi:MAG: FecR domain-containing protein [Bacteroidota bacterium]
MDELDKYKDLLNHQESDVQDELADFLRKSDQIRIPFKKTKTAIWDQIEASTDDSDNTNKTRKIRPWSLVGIAAGLSILLSFSILFLKRAEEVQVLAASGETKTELFPDGTKISINAQSSITYASGKNREIALDGEAFFEVAKGDDFIVETKWGMVKVLGTSFNVFAREETFEVACKTGKVSVSIPTQSFHQVIGPGEMVRLEADTVRQINRLPDVIGKWQFGELYFDNQPIQAVFAELQRQFDITIEYDDTDNQYFSGYFNNTNLENALEMVCLPLGLSYQKTGQKTFAVWSSNE